MTRNKIGIVRYPRIRAALMNISKHANRTKPADPDFRENIIALKSRLDAVSAHMEALINNTSA